MAEDKLDGREVTWRQLLPWTELFRGFQVALDLNKLLLAAAGILTMAFGWWLLAVMFRAGFDDLPPIPGASKYTTLAQGDAKKAWELFKRDREEWNLLHETAGLGNANEKIEVLDLASSPREYEDAQNLDNAGANLPQAVAALVKAGKLDDAKGRLYLEKLGKFKPYARLASGPWSENRGPNPYMLVTGQAGVPWEAGRFWDWFVRDQLLVMIEPLVKFVQPIVYFFSPRSTGFTTSFYFLLVMLWTLATWAVFGGAITRIAAVQVTRGEKIGIREAIRFTLQRLGSYLLAPLFPLIFVFLMLIVLVVFGYFHMIPWFGDIFVDGVFWWIPLILGLVMAVTLVGLVGWPLMSATISTEGTDSWEAVSRSYSYVYQRPWHYIWYSLVAIVYGAVLVFFVGFMGSLMVYLSKWGVSQTPGIMKANRDPSFLFAYAPTSFGWRTLLLEGPTVNGKKLVDNGQINPSAYDDFVRNSDYRGDDSCSGWNRAGAVLVAIWLGIIFLLMLGFGYSYFWSASTIVYLLMRRQVDAAEMDEVYLEEDEQEGPYSGQFTPPPPPAPSAIKPPSPVTMVEPPALRTPPTAPLAEPPKEPEPAPLPPPSEGEIQG